MDEICRPSGQHTKALSGSRLFYSTVYEQRRLASLENCLHRLTSIMLTSGVDNTGWARGLTLDHRLPLGINTLVQADADQMGARGIALSRRRLVRKNLKTAHFHILAGIARAG